MRLQHRRGENQFTADPAGVRGRTAKNGRTGQLRSLHSLLTARPPQPAGSYLRTRALERLSERASFGLWLKLNISYIFLSNPHFQAFGCFPFPLPSPKKLLRQHPVQVQKRGGGSPTAGADLAKQHFLLWSLSCGARGEPK